MPEQDALDTTLFYLEIMRSIPKVRKITVKEIRTRLQGLGIGRTERTIQRSLEKLCEHFEIECDMGSKPYGYRWKSESRGLSLPLLNEAESLLLMLAEQQLHQLLPAGILSAVAPFFEQARKKLTYDAYHKPEQQWLDKVAIVPTSQPLLPAPIGEGILETVGSALFQNKWLDITYRNQKGQITESRVMPLALVQQLPSLYLVVRYENFSDERHLALHRIQSARLSTMTCTRPKDFNLKRYQAEGRFGFGEGQSIRLTFSITRSAGYHLTETPFAKDQQILEENAGHYRIRATVIDSAMLDWWLAKFGEDIWDIEKITGKYINTNNFYHTEALLSVKKHYKKRKNHPTHPVSKLHTIYPSKLKHRENYGKRKQPHPRRPCTGCH